MAAARSALEKQTERLQREMSQMERIQEKFQTIHAQLCNLQQPAQASGPSPTAEWQHQHPGSQHSDERYTAHREREEMHPHRSASKQWSSQQPSPPSWRGSEHGHEMSKHLQHSEQENRAPLTQRFNV